MLQARYIIGFTGHRHHVDENRVRPALEQILSQMIQLAGACEGQAVLYASIAQGADTLCVEVARQLGMPTHLLEACDVLVAAWDGKPAKGAGGTSYVVSKAIAVGTPVVHIDPVTAEIRQIGDGGKVIMPDPIITELNLIETNRETRRVRPQASRTVSRTASIRWPYERPPASARRWFSSFCFTELPPCLRPQ